MEKVRKTSDGTLLYWCPGCDTYHGVWTENPNPLTGAQWQWNGSTVSPTFTPSIMLKNPICHSFITDGKIHFLADSQHKLAGETVCMVDIDK